MFYKLSLGWGWFGPAPTWELHSAAETRAYRESGLGHSAAPQLEPLFYFLLLFLASVAAAFAASFGVLVLLVAAFRLMSREDRPVFCCFMLQKRKY